MKGEPSPIYKERVWMVWRERNEVLLQIGRWLKAWLWWIVGDTKWLCFDLAFSSGQLVLNQSCVGFAFCHLGKNSTFHMGSSFLIFEVSMSKLTSKHTTLPYAVYLGTIGIRLDWFGDLVHPFANYALPWSGLPIRMNLNVWTKAKSNWPVHFVSIWVHLFFSMILIECKKN